METLGKIIALETLPLYTQNTHHFLSERTTWLTRYAAVRNNTLRYLHSAGHVAHNPSVDVGGDRFFDELTLMANVRAYWQVAYQVRHSNRRQRVTAGLILVSASSTTSPSLLSMSSTSVSPNASKRCFFKICYKDQMRAPRCRNYWSKTPSSLPNEPCLKVESLGCWKSRKSWIV